MRDEDPISSKSFRLIFETGSLNVISKEILSSLVSRFIGSTLTILSIRGAVVSPDSIVIEKVRPDIAAAPSSPPSERLNTKLSVLAAPFVFS